MKTEHNTKGEFAADLRQEMGGNRGKSVVSNKGNCFHCNESDHWVQSCPLKDVPCVNGCSSTMKLFWSSKQASLDCRFMKCTNPKCNVFLWVDTPQIGSSSSLQHGTISASSSSNHSNGVQPTNNKKNIKVTVEENGKKITFEGELDAVLDVMSKKFGI